MKKLVYILLISIVCMITFQSYVYSAPPTTYDRKQDKQIGKNKGNIQDNRKNINQNKDNITTNRSDISNHNDRINNHNSRIENLEETEYTIRGEVQFIREKNLTVGLYGKTDVRHPDINNEIGINIVIGVGESYTERKQKALEKRIANLEKKLGWIGVETIVTKSEEGYIISIEEKDKMKVLKRF